MDQNKTLIIVIAAVTAALILIQCFVVAGDDSRSDEKLETVSVTAYDMSLLPYDTNDIQDDKPIEYYKMDAFDFLVKKDRPEVLYTSIDTYVKLCENSKQDGYTFSTKTDGALTVWTITGGKNEEVFSVKFDADAKTVSILGDCEPQFKSAYQTTLMEQCTMATEVISGAGKYLTYSFAGYGLDPVCKDGKYYYSFGLLTASLHQSVQKNFLYSSKDRILFEFATEEQRDSMTGFTMDGNSMTIDKVVGESYKQYAKDTKDGVRYVLPQYMLEHTRDLFIYVMDQYYGLASVLGYKSMKDYIHNTAYTDGLISEDQAERGQAYSVLVSLLNDNHSSFTGSGYVGEKSPLFSPSYKQTLLQDRTSLSRLLSDLRQNELGDAQKTDVRYSQDGTAAYFSFDEFAASNYIDGKQDKDSDTYYLFVKNLKEIRERNKDSDTKVTRVIIDDTINHGGYVTIMLKLLALMSKDNYGSLYALDDGNGGISKMTARVDSNGDGKYDREDCFGNEFKFYILTTSYSFSCGNAFPFLAQASSVASVIGTKSGGGECQVVSDIMPFGQVLTHSSTMHLGGYDAEKGVFIGDEGGAPLTYMLDKMASIYNVDYVYDFIKKHENAATA